VSSFNLGLWLAILAGIGAVVLGSLGLRKSGRRRLATALVALPAIPGALIGLFFLVLIIAPARWN
jgi:hypothetical protein